MKKKLIGVIVFRLTLVKKRCRVRGKSNKMQAIFFCKMLLQISKIPKFAVRSSFTSIPLLPVKKITL